MPPKAIGAIGPSAAPWRHVRLRWLLAGSDQRHRRARRRCWKTFATLTKRRLKRGVFRSVIEPNQAVRDYLDAHNTDPKPFRWTAPADTIIANHQRGKRLLQSLH